MRFITEKEIEQKAGHAELTPAEIRDVAWSTAASSALVIDGLMTGKFTALQRAFRQELAHRKTRKAVEAWIARNRAVFDPHRKKWLLLDDCYDEKIS